jgi:hypothetical protein
MRLVRGIALISSTLVLSLVLARPAAAQQNVSNANSGIGVGIEGMAAFPSLRNAENSGLDAKNAYGFGLWVGGNKGGTVGFAGEFIYKVSKFDITGGNTLTRQALEIPAVFHINVGSRTKNGAVGYGIIGPVFTINVKDKLKNGVAGDNFAGADVGIMAGAGFEVVRIGVEGRGNWGLRNISDEGTTSKTKEFSFEVVGKFRFN